MEDLNEPITKTKRKPMKIQEETPLQESSKAEEDNKTEMTTTTIEEKKSKRKYTMSEKKQQQMVLLQEGKKRADAERTRMKELEAYKAIVENKLMEDVINRTKEKLVAPTKKKSKKIIVVEESASEPEEEYDDNDDYDEEDAEEEEIEIVKKKFPVKKQEPKSFKSLKNKKSDRPTASVQKQTAKPSSAKVYERDTASSSQTIDYSKYFV